MDFLPWIISHADKLPFVIAVGGPRMRVQLSYQRIIEAVVIGAVLAGIGYIAVIPRLEERVSLEIGYIRANLKGLENRIGSLEDKIDRVDTQRQQDYKELNSFRRDGGTP